MKIELSRSELAGAATWVAAGLSSNPYDPVLAGVLLETHHGDAGDVLRLSANNRETSARADISATVTAPGRVLVSGMLLAAVAKVLPDRPVELAVVGAEVVITCGAARATLPTLSAEEFPALPDLPDLLGQVPASEWARAVAQVAPAAAPDDAVALIGGVFIEIGAEGMLGLMATNRFRVAIRDLPWQPAMAILDWDTPGLLVPARLLMDLTKGMAPGTPSGMIRLAATPTSTVLGISDGTRHATTRLIDLPASDAGRVRRTLIPTGHAANACVPLPGLVEVVKRITAVAAADRSRPNQHLHLTFTPTELTVATTHGQGNAHAHDTLPITFTGEPAAITIKPTLLLPALTALDSTHLRIDLDTPNRPIQLRPATPDGEAIPGHTHAIAPLRSPDTPTIRAAA